MGRVLFLRTILLVVLCFGAIAPGSARASAEPLAVAVTQDFWEELESWMDQLCSFTNCDLGREHDSANPAESLAISLILSFQTYGTEQGLAPDDRLYGQAVSIKLLYMLEENPELFEPEVQKALTQTLVGIHTDLTKK
ncbi:MAG: hypothetical protein J0L78_15325 [Planctomycetes bacterium]|nr:hypothetical protein [Planctomycetota bacterium]